MDVVVHGRRVGPVVADGLRDFWITPKGKIPRGLFADKLRIQDCSRAAPLAVLTVTRRALLRVEPRPLGISAAPGGSPSPIEFASMFQAAISAESATLPKLKRAGATTAERTSDGLAPPAVGGSLPRHETLQTSETTVTSFMDEPTASFTPEPRRQLLPPRGPPTTLCS